MTVDECLQRFGLTPSPEFAPGIRRILAIQTALERTRQGDADGELMKLNCVQLFALGDAADSLAIWAAKQSSFDKACYIDVQLLCGAGVDNTLSHLDGLRTDVSAAAATCIRECIAAGDFAEFTPEQWVADYREYFGA